LLTVHGGELLLQTSGDLARTGNVRSRIAAGDLRVGICFLGSA